ncbi:MAG TPA: hypothetical protein PLU62_07960 [Ignavibacteriales bacterium]|nr:hypothetical protein [Ignavibacteriales bacterium]HPP33868.1 hypothetical protein [Ignavibacteriales bacterium]
MKKLKNNENLRNKAKIFEDDPELELIEYFGGQKTINKETISFISSVIFLDTYPITYPE